jgi:hypothetical protein
MAKVHMTFRIRRVEMFPEHYKDFVFSATTEAVKSKVMFCSLDGLLSQQYLTERPSSQMVDGHQVMAKVHMTFRIRRVEMFPEPTKIIKMVSNDLYSLIQRQLSPEISGNNLLIPLIKS